MAPRKYCYCHCDDGDDGGGGGDYPPCPGAATVSVTVPPLDRNPDWWHTVGTEWSSQTLEITVPATYDCSPGTCCAFVGDHHIGQHTTTLYDYTRCYFSLFGTDTGDLDAPWAFGLLILMCSEASTIQQANYRRIIDDEDETILGEYELLNVYDLLAPGEDSPFLNWPATITVS